MDERTEHKKVLTVAYRAFKTSNKDFQTHGGSVSTLCKLISRTLDPYYAFKKSGNINEKNEYNSEVSS